MSSPIEDFILGNLICSIKFQLNLILSLPINKVDVILFSPTHNNYVEVVDRKRMRISHKNSLLDTPWDNFDFKYKYLVKSAFEIELTY